MACNEQRKNLQLRFSDALNQRETYEGMIQTLIQKRQRFQVEFFDQTLPYK